MNFQRPMTVNTVQYSLYSDNIRQKSGFITDRFQSINVCSINILKKEQCWWLLTYKSINKKPNSQDFIIYDRWWVGWHGLVLSWKCDAETYLGYLIFDPYTREICFLYQSIQVTSYVIAVSYSKLVNCFIPIGNNVLSGSDDSKSLPNSLVSPIAAFTWTQGGKPSG